MRTFTAILAFSALLTAAACDEDTASTDTGGATLELTGGWTSSFGEEIRVSDTVWGATTVHLYDNAKNHVVVQSPANDMFTPNEFSKIVWTEPEADGAFWGCTVAFGKATAQEAVDDLATADASDPATDGCGGFSWTRWSPALELIGVWKSNFDERRVVTSTMWGDTTIQDVDNDANWMVVQSSPTDQFTANKFSKVVWTEVTTTNTYYTCTVAFGLDTLAEAQQADASAADASDPANDGCSGFSWTLWSMDPDA